MSIRNTHSWSLTRTRDKSAVAGSFIASPRSDRLAAHQKRACVSPFSLSFAVRIWTERSGDGALALLHGAYYSRPHQQTAPSNHTPSMLVPAFTNGLRAVKTRPAPR